MEKSIARTILAMVTGVSASLIGLPLKVSAQPAIAPVALTDESFDEMPPPAIPLGWETIGFVTAAVLPNSQPNAAFSPDPAIITDKSLFAPPFVSTIHAQLKFRHRFSLENVAPFAFDGVVLEVAGAAHGTFVDILDAGGQFAAGGYNHIIFSSTGNPLAGRLGWGGLIDSYDEVIINLPSRLVGCSVFVRWRMGTDDSGSGVGYWLDDVHADDGPPDEYIFAGDFEGQNCLQ